MKITYEELNELQRQQTIIDYAQRLRNTLICLHDLSKSEHKTQLSEMMKYVSLIEKEAIKNIRKMVEVSEDE